MYFPVVFSLASVVLISSIALVGLVAARWDDSKMRRRLPTVIAIAAGVLLGEASFHLIPESLRDGLPADSACLLVFAGIAFSYCVEKLCTNFLSQDGVAPVARISLMAESVHNIIDGAIIAAAYLTGVKVGLLATFAIAVHELPHELGNFAVLLDSGYSRKQALQLNVLSAGAAVIGAVAVLLLGNSLVKNSVYVLPVAAGCFVYMSLVDLLPTLWRRSKRSGRFTLGFGVTAGAFLMFMLTLTH